MRSRNLPISLATLALFLSFQEQCRIQAQAVEAGQLATSSEGSSPYPPSSRLGRRHAADQPAVQRRSSTRQTTKGSLKQRQLMDDDSAPAVVVRPVRQSGSAASSVTEEDAENADVDLSRAVRAAASTASGSGAKITRSIEISNGPRPGAPTSTSVSIPVSDTDVTQSATSTPSPSSSSSSESSSSSSSSTESDESSSAPTSTSSSSSSSSSSSHRSSESPSTVFSTTTMSSSSSSSTASPTDSSAPITNVWQAYNKNSRYFPVAIVITIVVGIAILVALVAILQCIARAPRFRKDKDRPLLIPRDSTWSDSNMSATSNLQSDTASRRDSISSQAAAAKRTTWETFNAGSSPSRLNSNASSTTKRVLGSTPERDVTSGSSATWAKEDFLPHSGEEDAVATPAGFSIVDVYPAALPKFRAPAPTNATPASNLGSPYPPFPARGSASSPSHNEQYQNILPVIRRVDPAIMHNGQQQQPMMERLTRGPSILFKPRPGPTEQQSGHRLSMGRNGLPSHIVLPPGIAERRRWERCST